MQVKLTCSDRKESWLRSFMRHGVGDWDGEVGAPLSPHMLWDGVEVAANVGDCGGFSPSPETLSIWKKFHSPTFLMQYEQVRIGRFIAFSAGLSRNTERSFLLQKKTIH